jgi:hypothetical protein
MNKEAYVSFETAKLLKEKGFDWEVRSLYGKDGDMGFSSWSNNYNTHDDLYSAPTQQMAMRWLREEKGIHIYPIPVTGFYYVVSVYLEDGNKVHNRILSRSGRHAYEDAIEVALQYCLTNMI